MPDPIDLKKCANTIKVGKFFEICPEMHANENHELYDRHHKVSPNLNSH